MFKITVILTILKLEDFLIKRHETKYFPLYARLKTKASISITPGQEARIPSDSSTCSSSYLSFYWRLQDMAMGNEIVQVSQEAIYVTLTFAKQLVNSFLVTNSTNFAAV